MELYSLFVSIYKSPIIKRLQGEGEDVLCLTKVAIRAAYESVSFYPDQHATWMPPLQSHLHSDKVIQTLPAVEN